MSEVATARAGTRAAIVEAAAAMLRDGGPATVTTRGVAEQAGVQAPTIYRLFGDKDGLLEAVAEHVMAAFVSDKVASAEAAVAADVDPLEDLVSSWRRQIDFSLANPAVFRLLSDPERVAGSPAARMGRQVLENRVHRLALTGRLRVSESHAIDLIQAGGVGAIQLLLATPPDQRDPSLVDSMIDAVLARILNDANGAASDEPVAAAVAVRARVDQLDVLSASERALLAEWLDRVIRASQP